jgi:hypothetical protein
MIIFVRELKSAKRHAPTYNPNIFQSPTLSDLGTIVELMNQRHKNVSSMEIWFDPNVK